MNLREQYERETGKKAFFDGFLHDYVAWLERRAEYADKLAEACKKSNKALSKLGFEGCGDGTRVEMTPLLQTKPPSPTTRPRARETGDANIILGMGASELVNDDYAPKTSDYGVHCGI